MGVGMPRHRRAKEAGLVFHVLNRSAKRLPLFANAHDYLAFERVLIESLTRHEVALFAYCLMPNHWHLVLSPRSTGALSALMHWLTTTHARRWQLVRGLGGQGAVYQGRFKAIPIAGDPHFLWVCRYVERNALRASLVSRAEEWPWSSLWARLQEESDVSWLSRWPVDRPPDWVARVNEPQTNAELDGFRKAMTTGTPYGDEERCKGLRLALGIAPRRKRGRPPKTAPSTVLLK